MLPPFRKNIFLTTKSPQRTRQGAEADLELSLRALQTDHVDRWQIHQVSTMDEVEQIFAPGGAIEACASALPRRSSVRSNAPDPPEAPRRP